jgi:hypothetical protein
LTTFTAAGLLDAELGAFGAFGVIGAFGLIGLIGPKGRRLTPSGHTAQAQAEQQRMDDQ